MVELLKSAERPLIVIGKGFVREMRFCSSPLF